MISVFVDSRKVDLVLKWMKCIAGTGLTVAHNFKIFFTSLLCYFFFGLLVQVNLRPLNLVVECKSILHFFEAPP